MKTIRLRLSASGLTSRALRALDDIKNPENDLDQDEAEQHHGDIYNALSALHDGLMAVATGKITPADAKDFFCFDDDAKYIGGVITFREKEPEPEAAENV